MSNSQEPQGFGEVRGRYRGSLVKAFLNAIIGLGFVGIGGALLLSQLSAGQLDAFGLLGGVLALPGLYLLVAIFRRQIGHSITLFEQGVRVKRRGMSLALRYDEIEDIVADVRRTSARPTRSKFTAGYWVYVDGKVAFTISTDLANWTKLAEQLKEAVVRVQVPRFLNRISKGETLRFTGMMTGLYLTPTPMTLALNTQGVQANDGPVASWESGKITIEADDWNSLVARLRTGSQRIEFFVENYPNGHMAYEVIKAYLQTQRKTL